MEGRIIFFNHDDSAGFVHKAVLAFSAAADFALFVGHGVAEGELDSAVLGDFDFNRNRVGKCGGMFVFAAHSHDRRNDSFGFKAGIIPANLALKGNAGFFQPADII